RVSGNGPSCASVPNPSTLLWASPVSTSITTKPHPQSSAMQAFGHSVHHGMIVSGSQLAATCQFRMRETLSDRHGITRQPRPAYCSAVRSSLVPIAMQARCVVFPADPVDYSGACVIAGEDVPSESHAAVRLPSWPAAAMHHREALAKDVDPRQSAPFQDPTPPLGLHKRKPQQQHNVRAKVERAFDKRLNDAVWRVSENTLGSGRHPCLGEKVSDEIQRETVVYYVASNHGMTGATQHPDNRAATGSGLP